MTSLRMMREEDVLQAAETEKMSFSDPWNEEMIRSELRSDYSSVYVMETDGVMSGWAAARLVLDSGEIMRIEVAPGFRGRGLSKLLMDSMIGGLKRGGAKEVLLEVRSLNATAIGLYEKYGFERISVRRGYYKNPSDDAVVMKREIM